jgi:D-alanyl-lipoteichoic acid acyltransferase DltB (MBOAT superfamily)
MNNFLNYSFDNPWFFTNYSFLITLGIFLVFYSILFNQKFLRKLYVILFSLFFYYKSSGPFILIFILLIICDYNFANAIERIKNKTIKKTLLVASILLSLSFLIYFKYSGFLTTNFNLLFKTNLSIGKLFLPIGISFYTFQSISYIVDVYNGKINSSRSFLDYTFYMTFFPHLVAGPIVRASDFIPQINTPHVIDRIQYKTAFFRILLGLSKKLLIADFLSKYVDMVHANPSSYSGFENLISMYAYACQIYFDFSGYSDIAIGIALLLGYELKENFDNPYKANNITDFWRRWHISLSSWLRDYIYIPLGGSRKGKFNTYLFLLITMTVGGIWHGASWNFIIWGVAHGIALVLHKLFFVNQNNEIKKENNWAIKIIGTFITFNFVSLFWILFRAENFQKAFDSVNKIISGFKLNDIIGFYFARKELLLMLSFAFVVIFMHKNVKLFLQKLFIKIPAIIIVLILILFLQFVLQIRSTEIAPFIYFQF